MSAARPAQPAELVFPCPSCGKRYKQPASAAGRRAKCASCGADFTLRPAAGTAKKRPPRPRAPAPRGDAGGPRPAAATDTADGTGVTFATYETGPCY